jgi:hypothetical protein
VRLVATGTFTGLSLRGRFLQAFCKDVKDDCNQTQGNFRKASDSATGTTRTTATSLELPMENHMGSAGLGCWVFGGHHMTRTGLGWWFFGGWRMGNAGLRWWVFGGPHGMQEF